MHKSYTSGLEGAFCRHLSQRLKETQRTKNYAGVTKGKYNVCRLLESLQRLKAALQIAPIPLRTIPMTTMSIFLKNVGKIFAKKRSFVYRVLVDFRIAGTQRIV